MACNKTLNLISKDLTWKSSINHITSFQVNVVIATKWFVRSFGAYAIQ